LINSAEFEKASGVGIVITDEDIQKLVDRLFDESAEAIKSKGHDF
jgi:hypothetical protein